MTISRNLSFLAEGVSSTGVLGATYGGTGQSSITTGDLLYGSASNTISKLAIGSTGTILRVVGGVPTWGTDYTGTVTSVAASVPSFLSISGSPITTSGTLAITYSGTALPTANGGTALTSFTSNGVLYASSSSALTTGSALQFDGSNLGIGVTPSGWGGSITKVLELTNSIHLASFQNGSYADLYLGNNCYFNGSNWVYKISQYSTRYQMSDGGQHQWYVAPSGTAGNTASFTQALTLFNSGGLSLGNTSDPGANNLSITGIGNFSGKSLGVNATILGADSRFTNIEFGNCGSLSNIYVNSTTLLTYLQHNSYVDSGGNTKFKSAGSNYASQYNQNSGSHIWQTSNAPGTAGNSVTYNTVMQIAPSGGVSIGNTTDPGAGNLRFNTLGSNGIYFGSGSQLNDYETGTWTPNDASGAGLTFSVTSATYVKVGRNVFITAYFSFPTTASTAYCLIGGLPFTSNGSSTFSYLIGRNGNSATYLLAGQVNSSTTQIALYYAGAGAYQNVNVSGAAILFSGSYISAT